MSSVAPWLVVIDMQNVFTSGEWRCPRFGEIIEPIRALAARHIGRTLLTRFVAGSEHDGSWKQYYDTFCFANVPDSDPIYDIIEPLRDLAREDNVVTMTTFSKWAGIRAITGDFPRLILTGVATDCCVLSTAISAAEAGAFVTVVPDACAGSSDDNQEAAKKIFRGYAPLIELPDSGAVT